jgi:hypothetical protein
VRRFVVAVAVAGLAAAGCTGDRSAALLTINSDSRSVLHLEIQLRTHDGVHSDSLTEPPLEGIPLLFPKTVSLTFPSSVTGYLDVHVDGKRGADRLVAGDAYQKIEKGGVTRVDVQLDPVPPGTPYDAGAMPDLMVPADLTPPPDAVAPGG